MTNQLEPQRSAPVIPAARPVIPAPTHVIPAKAGIHRGYERGVDAKGTAVACHCAVWYK